jgi:hypothetical protein
MVAVLASSCSANPGDDMPPGASSGLVTEAPSTGNLDPHSSDPSLDATAEPVETAAESPAGPVAAAVTCPKATVTVSTAKQLTAALGSAKAGAVIVLKPGRYVGEFRTTRSGTAAKPITLCGTSKAILDGDGIKGGYGFHLDGAKYWRLLGFTVTNAQKGVMADGTVGSVIQQLTVHKIGDEAIHLRKFSTDNVVKGNRIYDTGNRREKFGEGVYIGSAHSNWCDVTKCKPDKSDRNRVEGNTITDTTAEAIDIKEGTSSGVVTKNTFDGSGLVKSGADSWVDVKGNSWVISHNIGVDSPMDGFQVHDVYDGWGRKNVFRSNKATVNGPGFGFSLTPVQNNVVECSNSVSKAKEGFSNVSCG